MSDKPSTQDKQEQVTSQEQPLSWDMIGKLSKDEYASRRDEIQQWIQQYEGPGGRLIIQ
jgi:hypothetical protein